LYVPRYRRFVNSAFRVVLGNEDHLAVLLHTSCNFFRLSETYTNAAEDYDRNSKYSQGFLRQMHDALLDE
jgi:hypothetical protein